jgi:hypothetical protein
MDISWRRGLVAMHGWVRLDTGTCMGAREHWCHSQWSGQHGHAGVASPRHGAGWVQRGGVSWNWSQTDRRAQWWGDRLGGGRCCPACAGHPRCALPESRRWGRLGLLERMRGRVVGSTGDGGALWLGVDRLRKRWEGFSREEFASGSLSPSIPNWKRQGEEISPRSYDYREGDSQQLPFLLLVG